VTFSSTEARLQHQREVHPDEIVEYPICIFCGQSFSTEMDCGWHMQSEHARELTAFNGGEDEGSPEVEAEVEVQDGDEAEAETE
jgi:hypothetical protein